MNIAHRSCCQHWALVILVIIFWEPYANLAGSQCERLGLRRFCYKSTRPLKIYSLSCLTHAQFGWPDGVRDSIWGGVIELRSYNIHCSFSPNEGLISKWPTPPCPVAATNLCLGEIGGEAVFIPLTGNSPTPSCPPIAMPVVAEHVYTAKLNGSGNLYCSQSYLYLHANFPTWVYSTLTISHVKIPFHANPISFVKY